jgi:acetolactate synthase-1/2/3 large subunit
MNPDRVFGSLRMSVTLTTGDRNLNGNVENLPGGWQCGCRTCLRGRRLPTVASLIVNHLARSGSSRTVRSPMFVHEALAAELADHGVEVMFGLIGDANLFMANAFVEQRGGRYVSAVHEASAVMMAHGYASRTGRLGVATVTQGPGLTNTATALIEAVRSSSPIVLITGDTAPSNLLNQQSLSQEPFVRATGAGYVLVAAPADAADALAQAVAMALSESRPVVLNCPTEYQWVEVDVTQTQQLRQRRPSPPLSTAPPDDSEIDRAVGVIASARRPLVLVGRGVVAAGCRDSIAAFANRVGAPLMTTLRARNLYRADEGSVGVMGTVSTDRGSEVIADSDCVIVFGASLNTWTTVRNTLLTGKAVVHVDVSDVVLSRSGATALVRGDAEAVAGTIVKWLDEAEVPPSSFRNRVLADLRDEDLHLASPVGAVLDLGGALSAISAALPSQRTVVFDGGRFLGEAFKYIEAPTVAGQVLSTSFGAVGLGIGAAIGAAVAAPSEPTVLVIGDGGLMMSGLAELQSCVRQGIPIIVAVCNDGSYGAEYDQYVNKQVQATLSLFDWPSFADVARALGADGVTVDTAQDLGAALEAIRTGRRTLLIDIRVDAAAVPEVPH